ncbi:helix-turn-helix domain-containing protein [Candidatus Soleaferrea massiliensis]|uniref:helix-turn-helix domain-containing protein n=1 Tax=Candidatus Soleaferrea massiliensis TaxID=1470354 RepID=UPI0005914EA1|nr:cupin domain-containing protein [Candidatus Soleaferrea massiliensis]
MNRELNEIASRIRELREACDYTQEMLAKELGISVEQYREYEQVGENIPISIIYEIASKFGVDFTEIITGVNAKLDTYHVVKRGCGRSVDRYPGYRFEDLAFRFGKKIMQPLLVTLEPSDKPAALVTHKGQEFNLVLEGSVAVVFDDKEIILNEGDSIYFNPTHPHGQRCFGDQKARFLTVIAE